MNAEIVEKRDKRGVEQKGKEEISDRVTLQPAWKRFSSPGMKFFTRAFLETLIHDFWKSYNTLGVGNHQHRIPHLLREVHHLDEKQTAAA